MNPQPQRNQPTEATRYSYRLRGFLVSGPFLFFVSEDPVPPGAKLPHVLWLLSSFFSSPLGLSSACSLTLSISMCVCVCTLWEFVASPHRVDSPPGGPEKKRKDPPGGLGVPPGGGVHTPKKKIPPPGGA